MRTVLFIRLIPLFVAVTGAALLACWVTVDSKPITMGPRVEVPDDTASDSKSKGPADLHGKFATGPGKADADMPSAWPCFRGANLDAISTENTSLTRSFPADGPKKLWSIELAEGYAGPAVMNGRVYLLDYDPKALMDVLRCLSLKDGKEIWRRAYSVDVTRNHGITRTVPAVAGNYVVSLGPKCHVLCCDALTGDYKWGIDLVAEYRTVVPQWYAGQCPLIDGDRVILAPGGKAMMIAVELATGKVIWKSPNPHRWGMTHASVVPVTFAGKRMYVYVAQGGVAGVSAEDGKILWETPEWTVPMAAVPSPVPLPGDKIFLCGGYGAGSMMLQLLDEFGKIGVKVCYRLKPEAFGAEQQTPILYKGHLYGVIPGGQMVCMNPDGTRVWVSGAKNRYGLGAYMLADGMIIAVNDTGTLTLMEATEKGFHKIASSPVFEEGDEAWGPLALVGGRLLVRDLTRMVCLDLRKASYE